MRAFDNDDLREAKHASDAVGQQFANLRLEGNACHEVRHCTSSSSLRQALQHGICASQPAASAQANADQPDVGSPQSPGDASPLLHHPPPPLPAGLGLCPPLQCGANRSITLVGVRADWEASLARFSPFMPTASPAATTSEQQRTSSPSQRRLRSECERLPANTSEADDASHQSDDEAEPVPTPLSDIAFEGAHIVEFTELTASNSRIQLENFVEQFRGVGLAPLIRYKLTSLAVQSCQYNSLSKPLVQVSGSTF